MPEPGEKDDGARPMKGGRMTPYERCLAEAERCRTACDPELPEPQRVGAQIGELDWLAEAERLREGGEG